jgi:hypothetical protein
MDRVREDGVNMNQIGLPHPGFDRCCKARRVGQAFTPYYWQAFYCDLAAHLKGPVAASNSQVCGKHRHLVARLYLVLR